MTLAQLSQGRLDVLERAEPGADPRPHRPADARRGHAFGCHRARAGRAAAAAEAAAAGAAPSACSKGWPSRTGSPGLYNRRYFSEQLVREWNRARRDEVPLSLFMIDIDHFKRFNDTYGHLAGDRCIRTVGEAVQRWFARGSDLVARYGGEEFVVLTTGVERRQARERAEALRQMIRQVEVEGTAARSHARGHRQRRPGHRPYPRTAFVPRTCWPPPTARSTRPSVWAATASPSPLRRARSRTRRRSAASFPAAVRDRHGGSARMCDHA